MQLHLASILSQKGMTQSALADQIGVKKGFMSEIISGKKSPSFETLIAIAAALGVSIGELFGETPKAAPLSIGFHEGQAVPFAWRPTADSHDTSSEIAALKHGIRRPETYKVTSPVPWLALLPGDILIVDLGRSPKDGEIILVGLSNEDGFDTRTVLARFRDGLALMPDPLVQEPVLTLGTDPRAAWRATVRSIIRPIVA